MSFEVIVTDDFQRKAQTKKADFAALIELLEKQPTSGVALSRDCYKVRMAIAAKGKGKSGGARVITCVKVVDTQVFLLTIYDKSEQDSLSDTERDNLLRENGLL